MGGTFGFLNEVVSGGDSTWGVRGDGREGGAQAAFLTPFFKGKGAPGRPGESGGEVKLKP